MTPPSETKAAFTLIECLTVVVIAGILGALILPVLMRLQERAATDKCSGNMRQIGAALTLYAHEHNGVYPSRWDDDHLTWRQKLNLYLGFDPKEAYSNSKVWFCPSAKVMPPSVAPLVGHYGYNYMIIAPAWQRRMIAPPKPSRLVLVGEMNQNNDSFSYLEAPCFVGDAVTKNRFSHPGHTANYLFVDGHVETLQYVNSKNPPASIFTW